jgi:hypothetical protein
MEVRGFKRCHSTACVTKVILETDQKSHRFVQPNRSVAVQGPGLSYLCKSRYLDLTMLRSVDGTWEMLTNVRTEIVPQTSGKHARAYGVPSALV